jgi:hypothetical protein
MVATGPPQLLLVPHPLFAFARAKLLGATVASTVTDARDLGCKNPMRLNMAVHQIAKRSAFARSNKFISISLRPASWLRRELASDLASRRETKLHIFG